MPDIYLNFKNFGPDDESETTNLPTGVSKRLPIYCASYLHTASPDKLFSMQNLDDEPYISDNRLVNKQNIKQLSAQVHFTDFSAFQQFLQQLNSLVPESSWQYTMLSVNDNVCLAPLLWCNFLWPDPNTGGSHSVYSNGDCYLEYGPGKYTEVTKFLEFNQRLLKTNVGPLSTNRAQVPFALSRARNVNDLGAL